jgi:ribosome modulation factor
MSNPARKRQRRTEIEELRLAGRQAHAEGKARTTCPHNPRLSCNGMHWERGWDEAETERYNRDRMIVFAQRTAALREAQNEHSRLIAMIDLFQVNGDRELLAAILRDMAARLNPPSEPDLDADDYQAIYGWGGQG